MAHIYMRFDFGSDEEKAQLARHRLETWKQAFRLDKKLLYKFDRIGGEAAQEPESKEPEKPAKAKGKAKTESKKEASKSEETIHLLLRLGFSGHEKLTEQRWVDRIPTEEPFSSAKPEVAKAGDPEFAALDKRFEELAA